MRDICTNCGKWRGLHKWDTMQCPFSEKEDNLFLANQFYAEENAALAALAALRAERDELREALEEIANGRYGKSVAVKNIARAVLAKYEKE